MLLNRIDSPLESLLKHGRSQSRRRIAHGLFAPGNQLPRRSGIQGLRHTLERGIALGLQCDRQIFLLNEWQIRQNDLLSRTSIECSPTSTSLPIPAGLP